MALTRRDFLRLAGVVAAATTLPGCAPLVQSGRLHERVAGGPAPLRDWPAQLEPDLQQLGRLTFGPTAQERARVAAIGLAGWVEEQLAPASLDDGLASRHLRRFDSLRMTPDELDGWDREDIVRELRQATLLRQIYSRRQLQEIMVEFWSDHFHISSEKEGCWLLLTRDREALRPHALGRFRDLLWASAHSPAMLIYLDNQTNHASAPNENYARELLELHTLGVGGGYGQADVMELARCLTGWTVKEHFWAGEYTFDAAMHDQGAKRVLGQTIAPAGQAETEQVLELLAHHPATARFVSAKLARRFLGPDATGELIERAAARFLETDGDIAAVLRVVLLDGLAATPTPRPRLKRPVNLVASALRQLNARTDAGPALLDYLARMGQLPYAWPTPDGFPDEDGPWQGNLLPRWQFALALARGEIAGTALELAGLEEAAVVDRPAELLERLAALLGLALAPHAHGTLLAALAEASAGDDKLPPLLVAGLLAAPAYQYR